MDIDSLGFYNSILNFLEDPEEEEEVNGLLQFWNQSVLAMSIIQVGSTRLMRAGRSSLPIWPRGFTLQRLALWRDLSNPGRKRRLVWVDALKSTQEAFRHITTMYIDILMSIL